MLYVRHLVLALMLGAAVAGCSSDGGDKDTSGTAAEDSVTVAISAAEGGEVKLGKAALNIPAGALAEDLEVTLDAKKPASSLPDQGSLKGLSYDFGPDGTTFEKPVELTLPLVGTPGDGEQAVISWYDEAAKAWQDLPATVSGGVITAEVEHFTLFIVRFKGVAVGAFDCGFTACSGEGIEGTWAMAGACIDTGKDENPFAKIEGCQDAIFDVGVDASGEVTFEAGTFTYDWTFTGMLNLEISSACLTAVGQGATCEEWKLDDQVNCATTKSGSCSCTGPAGDPSVSAGTGTYTVDGSTISFMEEGDTEPDVQEICVKGDEAKVHSVKTELDTDTGMEVTETTTWVVTRK